MRLDISEILSEVGRRLPYDLEEPPLVEENVECTQPVTGRVFFHNTGGTLLVKGEAETCVALPCSRCAEYFERPVVLEIDEQFELRQQAVGPRTLQTISVVEEDESPIAGKLFDGHVFDLTEMLRQYLLLDEPAKPLPETTPEGFCAHCKRRPEEVLASSVEPVESVETPVNPAFAKLGQLFKENQE